MTALRIRFIAVLCLLCAPLTAGATDVSFEQGSLIIPEQQAYQSACGSVSSYGLVYRLLQQKVAVYWAVNPKKTSHHRCKNTVDDAIYTDGCDFSVDKDAGRPVSLLSNWEGTFSDDFATNSTAGNPNGTGEGSFKVDKNRKRVRYMGGPFIIDSTDAARVVELLKTNDDFAKFRGGRGIDQGATCKPGSGWIVTVHRANNAFVAPVARVMNEVPPPIALVKGRNTQNAGSVEILETYLRNAGLNFDKAKGTFEDHGQIFDVLDQDTDLISSSSYPQGKLNYAPDANQPNKTYYKVMWSPHWDGDTSSTQKKSNLKSALANIASFVDRGNSIFNECASISTYENSYKPADTGRTVYPDNLNSPTQFMTGVEKGNRTAAQTGLQTLDMNELATSSTNFPANSQDCSDPGRSGDCLTYTNYGDLFSQRGDYELSVDTSVVEAFRPRKGQSYNTGVVRMISTLSNNSAKSGWDLYVSRLKDNDSRKGNVIYLAGHSFAQQAGGNRVVLNTLLNLAYKPDSRETSRSEPVADLVYKPDGTLKETHVLSGTFLDTPPQSLFPERVNFRMEKAADWVFPYIEGRFRSLLPDSMSPAGQGFSDGMEWEASAVMPEPGSRTIFTVLGSTQKGLKRVNFERAQLDAGCVDDASTGKILKVCDLQEAMGWDRDTSGVQLDPSGTGKVDPLVSATTVMAINHMSQHFLQRVRGFCVAHSGTETMTPNEGQCDNRQFGEVRSTLGGLDHASPAVVSRSRYIVTPRVEVAYIGGRDGQLHAIYLRGTQTGFSAPAPGTELWAFVPKGQLPRLMTNNARVDISPSISDVYADYEDSNGDGVLSASERSTTRFSWRTVLVSGSGRLGGELFALDVTDPLKPIVLWDVVSGTDNFNSGVPAENTALLWRDNWKEGGSVQAPAYGDLTRPTELSGPYNYADLGDTLNVNLVPVRRGNRPSFQVVVATNGGRSGAQQLQVFAIDAGTGRKLWQWERPYGDSTSNSVPGGTSTLDVDGDGSVDRVYVGDMEGRIWELSAHSGVNLNAFNPSGSGTSYSLFATYDVNDPKAEKHPVTTAPAIMRLPSVFNKDSLFTTSGLSATAAGKLALVFGTAGVDWVAATAPTTSGRVYVLAVLPEDLAIRKRLSYDKTTELPPDKRGDLATWGTLTSKGGSALVQLSNGERVVGSPKIVGDKIVLSTAMGNTESDLFSSNPEKMKGYTHLLNLNSTTPDVTIGQGKNSGDKSAGKSAASVLVLPDGSIVNQSMTGIQRTPKSSNPGESIEVPKTGLAGKRTPVRIGSWLDLGRALAE